MPALSTSQLQQNNFYDAIHKNRRIIIVTFLTIIWHLLIFVIPWKHLRWADHSPPPVAVKPMDVQQLEKIRQQWKAKQLLLEQQLADTPKVKEAPKDARYFSDRNRRVEKEQRAAQTQVMPQQGGQTAAPQVSQLGVPLDLSRGAGPMVAPRPRQRQRPQAQAQRPQLDQSIHDPDLSVGNMNLLNTAESVYYTYFSRLYQAIGPLWQSDIRAQVQGYKGPAKEYTTDVFVIFDQKGRLKRFEYAQPSGVPLFDQTMERAWKKIGRFPNPPEALVRAHPLTGEPEVSTRWVFRLDLNGMR